MSPRHQNSLASRIQISCSHCSLAELCLPRGLSQPEIDQLNRIVRRRRPVPRGDHVFQMGDASQALYAVHSGCVKSCTPTPDGHEQILGFHLPGELVGLDALEHDNHMCAAVAMETVHVCELPLAQLEEMCHRLPGLPHRILRLIGREVAAKHAMLLLLAKRSAEARLATFLLNLASRFSQRGFSGKEFNLSMPRDDIANYLGLARETVSRLLTRFQGDGLLSVHRRRVHIRDTDRLQALAGLIY
ncbi:MAG: fumarate/nitrate reduction transcriptional regulator Fnr [Acidiferrobacterales bacterium]|nr:fumarate/nitrate reduction transcriptional regulator Fnr [Acidiferrobacterales bacterium]